MHNRGINLFDDCLQKVTWGKIDKALKNDVADKILELLEQEKASMGTRQKTLFAQAITVLSTSINSIYQSEKRGLRSCLITLQKAMTPENRRDDPYAQRDGESINISYDMLVTTVKMIKGKIV